ncbi:conjugal transfer protein TraF [Bacterioplanoides sp.]|uniref:conjugal transfer protein TraF n=1 Tax=Bacterioplanoides sp. TaxID=2066072 RepID=UPI003AFFC002
MLMKHKLCLVISGLMASSASLAAIQVADSRGNGMGFTGVSSANYLAAPFYNPSLVANHAESADVRLMLPVIGAGERDDDEVTDASDALFDTYEDFKFEQVVNGSASQETIDELNAGLNDLAGEKEASVTATYGFAVAIPGLFSEQGISANFFGRRYGEAININQVLPQLGAGEQAAELRYDSSNHLTTAFEYYEYGASLAKNFTYNNHQFSLGVSPKYQRLFTYVETPDFGDLDLITYENSVHESSLNVDLGATWYKDQWRVAAVVKDLFKQTIETQLYDYEYELGPQVTLGGSYVSHYFTAALDIDVTKQKRFSHVDDDTRLISLGVEGNAWDWVQLRAGYQIDLENTFDNTVTFGLGLSPFNLLNLDLAVAFADEEEGAVSAGLSFTF